MLQAIEKPLILGELGRTPNQESLGEWVRSSARRYAPWLRRLLPALAMAAVFILALWAMLTFMDTLSGLGNWSYLGVFIAEGGNAATFIIPTPAAAYTLTVGVFLNPFFVGLLGGIGATLGELTGYYVGRKGARVMEEGRLLGRFKSVMARWTGLALFAFSVLPLPLDMAGLWAGSVRYPVWRFLACIAPGKVIRVTATAAAGYYGMSWLMNVA